MTFERLLLFAALSLTLVWADPPAEYPATAAQCAAYNDYAGNCDGYHSGQGYCMWCPFKSDHAPGDLQYCIPWNAGGCCAGVVGRGNCLLRRESETSTNPCQWCGTFSQTPCITMNATCPAPEDCYVAQTPLECQARTDAHNLTCAWCGNYGCVNFGDCHIDHEWPIRPAYSESWLVTPCSLGYGADTVVAVRTNHSSTFVAIWEVQVGSGLFFQYVRLSDMLITMPDPIEIPQLDGTFVYEFHIPASNKYATAASEWQLTLRAFDKKVKTWSNTTVIQVNTSLCNTPTYCENITDYKVCSARSCKWCGMDGCITSDKYCQVYDFSGSSSVNAETLTKVSLGSSSTSCTATSGRFAWKFSGDGLWVQQYATFWYYVPVPTDSMPQNKTQVHLRIWPNAGSLPSQDHSTVEYDMSFWVYHPTPGYYSMRVWLLDYAVQMDSDYHWAEVYWEKSCSQLHLLLRNAAGTPDSFAQCGYNDTGDACTWQSLQVTGNFAAPPNFLTSFSTLCGGTGNQCTKSDLFCNVHDGDYNCTCSSNTISSGMKCRPTSPSVSCLFEVINSSMDAGDLIPAVFTAPFNGTYTEENSPLWCREIFRSQFPGATWYTFEIDAYQKFARCSIYENNADGSKLHRGVACSTAWPHCETGIAKCSQTTYVTSQNTEFSIHPSGKQGTEALTEQIYSGVQSADECVSLCANFKDCVAWMYNPMRDTNMCLVSSAAGTSGKTALQYVTKTTDGTPQGSSSLRSGIMDPTGCTTADYNCYNGNCLGRRSGAGCTCPGASLQSLEQPPLLNVRYNWVTNKISLDVIVPQTNPARTNVKASLPGYGTAAITDESSCLIVGRNLFGELDVANLVSNATNNCQLDTTDTDNYRYRCVVSVHYEENSITPTRTVDVPLPFSIIAPLKPNVTIGMHHMGVKTLWAYVSKSKATFDAFGNATFLIEVTTLAPIYSVIEPDSIDFDLLGKVTGVELLNYTDVKHNQQLASWNLSITVGSSVCTLSENDGVMMNFNLNHSTTGVEPHAIKLTIGSFESLCSVTTGVEDNFQNFLFFSDFPDLGQNSSASQGAYNGLFFPNNTIYAGVYLALPWAPRVWPNVTIAAAVATGAGISDLAPTVGGHHQVDLMPYLHPMPCPVPTMTEYNYQKNLVVCFGLEIMKGYYIPDSEIKVDVTLIIINTTMLPEVTAEARKRTTAEFAIQGTFKLARAPTAEMRKPEIAAPETPKPLAQQQPQVRIVYRTPFAAYATMLVVALASGWCLAALASYLYNRSRSSSAMLL